MDAKCSYRWWWQYLGGKTGSDLGMDREADYMGMLATVMNALALKIA